MQREYGDNRDTPSIVEEDFEFGFAEHIVKV
jgi:hypothetical protein